MTIERAARYCRQGQNTSLHQTALEMIRYPTAGGVADGIRF
jgi:hypothetical protein